MTLLGGMAGCPWFSWFCFTWSESELRDLICMKALVVLVLRVWNCVRSVSTGFSGFLIHYGG